MWGKNVENVDEFNIYYMNKNYFKDVKLDLFIKVIVDLNKVV